MTRQELSNAVEQSRQVKGMSYRQLAEQSGRDLRAVQAVCKGWYNYGIDTLIDIARALELKITINN